MAPDIDNPVNRYVIFNVNDAAASVKRGVVQLSRRFIDDDSSARTGIQADDNAVPMINSARIFTSERIEWSGALRHLDLAFEFLYVLGSRYPGRLYGLAALANRQRRKKYRCCEPKMSSSLCLHRYSLTPTVTDRFAASISTTRMSQSGRYRQKPSRQKGRLSLSNSTRVFPVFLPECRPSPIFTDRLRTSRISGPLTVELTRETPTFIGLTPIRKSQLPRKLSRQ
jgi:hypothetical protein